MKNSDVFIMIPVSGALTEGKTDKNEYTLKYNIILTETSEYECDKKFADTIKREEIGKIQIAYMSDEYEADMDDWIDAYCCYGYQKFSDLGLLQIFIPSCDKEDSQIGDIVFSGHLRIRNKNIDYSIDEYAKYLGLCLSGKIRMVYCNSIESKSDEQIGYLLAGETSCSEHADYRIRTDKLEELSANNISKYDFYELYASQRSIVYLLRGFGDNFSINMEKEALLIYICEIAILQNAAISRINAQIVDELMQNSNISASKTLKLQVEFGKTILLWDNSIYNYYLSQELSNDIVKAFGTDKMLEEYSRNSKHIEQIAALKSGIASELEGKILNILAFILSISELVQLVKSIIAYSRGHLAEVGVSGGGIVLLIIVLALIRKRTKR